MGNKQLNQANKIGELTLSVKLARFLIKVYQHLISPFLGKNCRFYPTCSQYTLGCIEVHGLIKGTLLGILRIAKCAPWHPGGYDPVPEEFLLFRRNKSSKTSFREGE
ncbi:MAG: Putative membrane protein insertion efficiency factor [Thermovirga lienii]|nr:MAG: Putative membrane protein insertion efficiency factor [Thermovirga lienii]